MDIGTRIEALERRVIRLRFACAGLLAFAVVALVAAFAPRVPVTLQPRPGVLEARQILLRDEAGNVRVEMNTLPELKILGPNASVRFCAREIGNLMEMHGGGAGLEFAFAGTGKATAPHFYLYDAGGVASLDLEPSFANLRGDGGQLSLNANEAGDTGITFRNREGDEVLFRAP